MTRPQVYVTRRIPAEGIDLVRQVADAEVWQGELPPSYEVLLDRINGIDGLLCLLTDRVDSKLLDAAQGTLRVVSQMAVGFDNIDVRAATERGIPVGHTPGVLTEATADFAWALLMAGARRIPEADRHTRAGRWKTWDPTLLLGTEVAGSTLGIVGLGRIGQAVAKRARGFDMRILYFDTSGRRPDLEQSMGLEYAEMLALLQECDFLSLHVPLVPETHHLIGAAQLAAMKPTAILINTARGPIVDPEALYAALTSGQIACAALDVTEPEPIPADSPLLTLDNVIITPHIASASVQARTKMATMAAENLLAGLGGERLPNCANPEVYG